MRETSERQMSTRQVRSARIAVKPPTRFGRLPALADIMLEHANSFGLVRLMLAIAVLVSHSYWYTSGSATNEPLYMLTGWTLGEHAVQVFFILSGLLVAQSFAKSGSVVDFTLARALRIVPGLVVCVLATSILLGLAVTTLPPAAYLADPRLWWYEAKTLTLMSASLPLPGVFEHTPVAGLFNGSLWTLKFEVLCYGVLAGLGALGLFLPELRALAVVLTALLVAACTLMLQMPPCLATQTITGAPHLCPHAYDANQNVAYFIVYFFTGVLFFLVRDRLRLHLGFAVLLGVLFAATIGTRGQNLTTALFLGYAMLLVAQTSFGGLTRWTRKTDLSFGLYIYAAPLQQAIVHAWPGIDAPTLTVAALCAAWPCAWLSWVMIERPALGLRRRIGTRERPVMPEKAIERVDGKQRALPFEPAKGLRPLETQRKWDQRPEVDVPRSSRRSAHISAVSVKPQPPSAPAKPDIAARLRPRSTQANDPTPTRPRRSLQVA